MKFEPIEIIENPFYFGIGGIGDFLLLMATFYDDVNPKTTDVIFVCNNVNTIREFTKQFPNVNRFWFYPMSAFYTTPEMWNSIVRNPLCLGTGATPCEFRYVGDWIECGRSNVFDYYGLKRNPSWCSKIINLSTPHVTIQPNGGRDSNRISIIQRSELVKMVGNLTKKYTVYLIGSKEDIENYGIIDGASWVKDFDDTFQKIRSAEFHIGVNSWCKTYAGLAGISTYIYPSTYLNDPIEVFGDTNDPSDYVFLKQGGWNFLDWRDYAND